MFRVFKPHTLRCDGIFIRFFLHTVLIAFVYYLAPGGRVSVVIKQGLPKKHRVIQRMTLKMPDRFLLAVFLIYWGNTGLLRFLFVLFVLFIPGTSNVATCAAGQWADRNICQPCAHYGIEYTSDAGAVGNTSCYMACDDGTRAYWPNTCTSGICAIGGYMVNGVCTRCLGGCFCHGDNTMVSCLYTVPADALEGLSSYYTLPWGSSWLRDSGRNAGGCYCVWSSKCPDGSCNRQDIINVCYLGQYSSPRILYPEWCNTGYYTVCKSCTGLPENATFTGYGENGDNCPWRCNDGYGRTSVNTCAALCSASFKHIHTSTGLAIPLFSEKYTSHLLQYVKSPAVKCVIPTWPRAVQQTQ